MKIKGHKLIAIKTKICFHQSSTKFIQEPKEPHTFLKTFIQIGII